MTPVLFDPRGSLVARVLAGSWRADPPPLQLSRAELQAVAPTLLATGCASLAWWRVRTTPLHVSRPGQELQQAYRLHSLQALVHADHRRQLVELLGRAGIALLLTKGWSAARLYPQEGLRPYGDLDLYVQPCDWDRVQALLARHGRHAWQVDLHQSISELRDRSPEEIWRRSLPAPTDAGVFRVLGPEDHLRQLCLHFARHGGWRPLWLCDVAATLENLPTSFDWDYFHGGERHLTDWACCVASLAGRLLGARSPRPLREAPAWAVRAVLREWSADRPGDSHTRDAIPFRQHLRRPWGLLAALRRRWPNPIEAAFKAGVSPYQSGPGLAAWRPLLRRAIRFFGQPLARPTAKPFVIHEE